MVDQKPALQTPAHSSPTKLHVIPESQPINPAEAAVEAANEAPTSIAKPGAFDLDKFKSKRAAAMAGVETLQTGLPHHSISTCSPR